MWVVFHSIAWCINMRWYWTPLCPFPSPTWFLFEFTPYYDFSLIRFQWDWVDNVIVYRFDCGVFCVGRYCGVEWVVVVFLKSRWGNGNSIILRFWSLSFPTALVLGWFFHSTLVRLCYVLGCVGVGMDLTDFVLPLASFWNYLGIRCIIWGL